MKRLPSLLSVLFLTLGCANNPPRVNQLWWLPVLSLDSEGTRFSRELILYVHARDDEGEADIAELRLENPSKEIFWKMDSTRWSKWETKGETWIGSSRIMGDFDSLSRDEYRLILEDRGGRTGEITLFLEGWPPEELALEQKITSHDGIEWLIESDFSNWLILNARDEFISCPVNVPFNLGELAGEGPCYLILYNKESMWALRRGPYLN